MKRFFRWPRVRLAALAFGAGLILASPAAGFLPAMAPESRLAALRGAGFAGVPAERAFHLPTGPLPASYHHQLLVILVEFRDRRADDRLNSPARIHQRIFGADSTSLASYWRRASRGRFELAGQVTRWVRLDSTYAYYSSEGAGNSGNGLDPYAYPHNAQRMVEEAVSQIAGDYRWSDFDNNADGLIDGLLVIHAGPGLEEVAGASGSDRLTLLAHQYHTSYEVPVRGGLSVFDYALVSEGAPPGPLAHEFGHLLGLIDLYQTGAFTGPSGPWGLGDWSLMGTGALLGGGAHPAGLDGVSRLQLGFVTADTLQPGATLEPRELSPDDAGRTVVPIGPGPEYFLLEARRRRGDDALLPGEGLLIYHVDERSQTNSAPARYRVALVQADGRNDLGRTGGNRGDGGDPFPGSAHLAEFGEITTPSSASNDGADTGFEIRGIVPTAAGSVMLRLGRTRPVDLEVTGVAVAEATGPIDGIIEPGEQALVALDLCNRGTDALTDQVAATLVGRGADSLRVDPVPTSLNSGTIAARQCAPAPWTVRLLLASSEEPRDAIRAELRTYAVNVPPYHSRPLLIPLRPGRERDFPFPADDDSWFAAPAVAGSAWRLEPPIGTAADGSLSWHFGPASGVVYAPRADASLESPGLVVPERGRLTFLHYMDAETLSTGRAWDGGRVEITTDGERWEPLDPAGGYPFVLETGSGNALYGEQVFSGHDTEFNTWHRVVADLSPWAGRAIQLRFRFVSDAFGVSSAVQGQRGWWIDEVVLGQSESTVALDVDSDPALQRVRLAWSDIVDRGWSVFRRPAFVPGPRVFLGYGARTGDGSPIAYAFDDSPPPGDWIYSIRRFGTDHADDVEIDSRPVGLAESVAAATFDCFPNPWRLDGPPLNVDYSLPTDGGERRARLDLLDTGGRLVASLLDVTRAGTGRLQWSGPRGRRLAAGLYFLRMTVDGKESRVRRVMVIR